MPRAYENKPHNSTVTKPVYLTPWTILWALQTSKPKWKSPKQKNNLNSLGKYFNDFDVDVDTDADHQQLMLSWIIRLLCGLLKKVNNDEQQMMTPEDSAISAAKIDVDAVINAWIN